MEDRLIWGKMELDGAWMEGGEGGGEGGQNKWRDSIPAI